MVDCPTCRQTVPSDGHFCDQCGGRLQVCRNCGAVNTARFCTSCSAKLPDTGSHIPSEPATGDSTAASSRTADATTRKIYLKSERHGIQLAVRPGEELGREAGPHSSTLGQFKTVSRRHARIDYSEAGGWCVIDLGSAYGTDCRENNGWTQSDYRPTPGNPIPLIDRGYLRLSDVVLRVHINHCERNEDHTPRSS